MSRQSLLILLVILMASCTKHEQIEFSGTIVDARYCTMDQRNGGYVVALDYPQSYGNTTTVGETQYTNAIILYDSPRRIYVDDHITGTFYRDDKYSRSNCAVHYSDDDLPEGVFTKISVDG